MAKKAENPASGDSSLNDSTKLAIRDEVEKRVEQRESLYWKFGGLFVALVVLFFAALWKVSVSEIRQTVENQLAEKEVVKARDRIMAIKSSAEDVNRNLNGISASMITNQQWFIERLNQIKQQDNVVLADDLSKLFVIQTVTNLADGQNIVLDCEPIPHTIELTVQGGNNPISLAYFGHLEGKAIVISSERIKEIPTLINRGLKVEYVRKSLR